MAIFAFPIMSVDRAGGFYEAMVISDQTKENFIKRLRDDSAWSFIENCVNGPAYVFPIMITCEEKDRFVRPIIIVDGMVYDGYVRAWHESKKITEKELSVE